MSVSDPVADMLTKIRNAAMARHEKVDISAMFTDLHFVSFLLSLFSADQHFLLYKTPSYHSPS